MTKDPDFFIIGLQKSGTYGLSALLDAHPQIRCLPNHPVHNYSKGKTGADEGRIFDMLAGVEKDGGKTLRHSFLNHHGGFFQNIVPLIGRVNRDDLFQAVKKRYLEWFQFHNKENKLIVGDKTTEYVFHLPLIDDFFPKAKKVCIIRDPKDRIVSWNFHQIRKGRKSEEEISNNFIKNYLENRIKKEYQSMLDYGGRIYGFTYEFLKTKPRETIASLLVYLGADQSGEIIVRMREQASFENLKKRETLYLQEVREELTITHYRKGEVGEWQDFLTPAQVDMVDGLIGDLERRVFEKYHVSR